MPGCDSPRHIATVKIVLQIKPRIELSAWTNAVYVKQVLDELALMGKWSDEVLDRFMSADQKQLLRDGCDPKHVAQPYNWLLCCA